MTNQEILEKAIQKAIDGGWTGLPGVHPEQLAPVLAGSYVNFIFSHNFAKALWGEEPTHTMTHYIGQDNKPHMIVKSRWQVELQQMVIADDPIAYLGERLDD